jgi:hypothetical protein
MAPHRKRLINAVIPTNQAVGEKNEYAFPFSCAGIWFPHLSPGNQRTATAGERKRRRQAAADAAKPLHAAGFSVRINEAPARVSFNFLAEHYLKADFGADAVRPKSVNTIGHVEQVVRASLIPRFGDEIAEDIKPFDIQRWLKSLHEPGRSGMDDDLQDAGHHEPHLQDRNPARARREESRATCRDALEERLKSHRHHACANACDSEGPPLTSSLHAGPDLCRYGAPCLGDPGATLIGLAVERGKDSDFKTLAKGRDGETKTEASDGYVPLHPILAAHLRSWREQNLYSKDADFVFPSLRARGRVPLSASVFVADHLRPAAKKAGVSIEDGQRFGLHNLRHSLSNWMVNKAKVEPKTVQRILRHAKIQTTLDLYTQEDGDETLAAQGEYLTALGVATQWVQ